MLIFTALHAMQTRSEYMRDITALVLLASYLLLNNVSVIRVIFTRRGIMMRILSVRPSVRLSHACIVTKR